MSTVCLIGSSNEASSFDAVGPADVIYARATGGWGHLGRPGRLARIDEIRWKGAMNSLSLRLNVLVYWIILLLWIQL